MSNLLRVGQAAKLLYVSKSTVRRWADAGRIQTFRVGPRKDRRLLRNDVERMMAKL